MALYKTDADKNLIKISGNATRQLPLGAIFCSAIVLTDPAYKRLDGQCIAIDGVYSQFCEWLISQNTTGNVPTCTIGEYGTEISTCGQCGKFVINTTSEILTENGATIEANSIKLPTITAFIESTNNTYSIGTAKEAGLPNIKGDVGSVTFREASASGAFSLSGSGSYGQANSSINTRRTIYFNASKSDATYGKSDTVQPKSVSYPYYIVVATGTKTDVEVDINNVLTEVGKSQKRYLVERWELSETNTWYEIYSDGYKKCGGIGLGQNITHTITFPITFKDTNYLVKLTGIANNSVSTSCVLGVVNTLRTETQMKIQSIEFGYGYYWEAEGY